MRPELTALIVPLRQLKPLLQPFLLQHVRSPAAHVPPHITLHMPFLPISAITTNVLYDIAQLCSATSQFAFHLATFNRFPQAGVLYLEPEPVAPLLSLSAAFQSRYPEAPPDFPQPIMHLTLAYGYAAAELDQVEREFTQAYNHYLPLQVTATTVSLYVKQDSVWHERTTFPLSNFETA